MRGPSAGSGTRNSSKTETTPGSTANHSTLRMSSAKCHISAIASSGPSTAPMVSIDWRRPNAAPRISGATRSPTIASRGAPRMPLPKRSVRRATVTIATESASGNSGFDAAASP